MHLNVQPRGGGKTTTAVDWVKADRKDCKKDSSDRIIVVISEREKMRLMDTYDLGYHEVETAHTMLHYYKPTLRLKQLWLDNVDIILQDLFGGCVAGISMTKYKEDSYAKSSS